MGDRGQGSLVVGCQEPVVGEAGPVSWKQGGERWSLVPCCPVPQ